MQILFIHLDETQVNRNNQCSAHIANESFIDSSQQSRIRKKPCTPSAPFGDCGQPPSTAPLTSTPLAQISRGNMPLAPLPPSTCPGTPGAASVWTKQVKCFGSAMAGSHPHRLTRPLSDLQYPTTRVQSRGGYLSLHCPRSANLLPPKTLR